MRLMWSITAHVCVACMGRLLERPLKAGEGSGIAGREHERMYRCADCGIQRFGLSASVLCTCGLKVNGRHNFGMRCAKNRDVSPEFSAEIIAQQA